jgi:hypothetical protein
MRNWLRRPKTTQERRASMSGWNRAKRNMKNLPNTWDDNFREPLSNWKSYRKTQYKLDSGT